VQERPKTSPKPRAVSVEPAAKAKVDPRRGGYASTVITQVKLGAGPTEKTKVLGA
ncbi:hypothetical protein LCGC14_2314040, partial [marine sediment metagenome]